MTRLSPDATTVDAAFWLVLVVLCLAAAATDVRSYRIPNAIPIAVALLLLVRLAVVGSWHDVWLALMVGSIALTIGFGLFMLGWLGGGDVKLIAALSLWAGPERVYEFVYVIALSGGVMALGLLVSLTFLRLSAKLKGQRGRQISIRGRHLPYGVAIAAGAVYLALDTLGML